MPKFKPYNYNQTSMVIINYEDQLQTGTFEHAVHHLINNKLDLSIFHHKYNNESAGRLAYDPAILLKIILFAYSKGITSSREIQWCCESNIIFKALSCDAVPHFTTIASFVSGNSKEIEQIFEQVLLICNEEGLLGNELFAIDGCKISSNASKEWSGTFKELEQKRKKIRKQIRHHLKEHKKTDNNDTRDEQRRKRSQKAIETLNKAHDKIDKFLKSASPRMGNGKRQREVKSNITDNESAKMKTSKGTIQGFNGLATTDKKNQIIVDAQVFGDGQEHHTLQPILESVKEKFSRLGISDDIYKDGTIITADTGFANEDNMKYLQENDINAYIPDNQFRSRDPKFKDQKDKYGKRNQNNRKSNNSKKFTSDDFDFEPENQSCTCPAGNAMWLKNEAKDKHGNQKIFFEGRLTDCRNCNLKHKCMRNPDSANTRKGSGRQVSFITANNSKSRTPHTDWMKQRVDSDYGKLIYSHRMSVVEPVFANIGTNKGLNRFSLRGKTKVQGQWLLYCLVHNIEKIQKYGDMAVN